MYAQKRNRAASLFKKQNYNVLPPNFHIHVYVSDLYIPSFGLPILLQPNRQIDPGNIGIGNEVAQFHFWEHVICVFGTVQAKKAIYIWGYCLLGG
jgi:hypothetical protein